MEKISRSFPMSLFFIYFIKIVLLGAGIADATVMFILAALIYLQEVKLQSSDKKEVLAKLDACLSELAEYKKQTLQLKNEISAFKMLRK